MQDRLVGNGEKKIKKLKDFGKVSSGWDGGKSGSCQINFLYIDVFFFPPDIYLLFISGSSCNAGRKGGSLFCLFILHPFPRVLEKKKYIYLFVGDGAI